MQALFSPNKKSRLRHLILARTWVCQGRALAQNCHSSEGGRIDRGGAPAHLYTLRRTRKGRGRERWAPFFFVFFDFSASFPRSLKQSALRRRRRRRLQVLWRRSKPHEPPPPPLPPPWESALSGANDMSGGGGRQRGIPAWAHHQHQHHHAEAEVMRVLAHTCMIELLQPNG